MAFVLEKILAQTQWGADAGTQPRSVEGLLDVVRDAALEGADLEVDIGAGAEEDHGNLAQAGDLLDPHAGLEAVHPGHDDVEEDQVERFGGRSGQHLERPNAIERETETIDIRNRSNQKIDAFRAIIDDQCG